MKQRDVIFKLGLALQLLLIPLALLWRFSQEANYYNWIISASFIIVVGLFFWPQTLLGRLKRLAAIKLQFVLTLVLLSVSWIAYLYFHRYIIAHDIHYAIYSVRWESIFRSRWVMLLGPGISPSTAVGMTLAILALPFANLYRYQIDRKRINGIKKDDLFI